MQHMETPGAGEWMVIPPDMDIISFDRPPIIWDLDWCV